MDDSDSHDEDNDVIMKSEFVSIPADKNHDEQHMNGYHIIQDSKITHNGNAFSSIPNGNTPIINKTSHKDPSFLEYDPTTPFVKIEKDKLTVKYIASGDQHQDFGTVKSNKPFQANELIDYFEVNVLSAGVHGYITVGVSSKETFVSTRQVGWDINTFGYNGYDGKKYNQSKHGKSYGDKFGEGDTVGCGIIYNTKEIFFTKNGKNLGTAFYGVSQKFYPTVSLDSKDERIRVNFGKSLFKYDIQSLINKERNRIQKNIKESKIDSDVSIVSLIESYLFYSGYKDTLVCLQESLQGNTLMHGEEKQVNTSANDEMKHLKQSLQHNHCYIDERKQLSFFIQKGFVEDATELLKNNFYDILKNNKSKSITLRLRCQQFIEYIRQKKIIEALKFSTKNLQPYVSELPLESLKEPSTSPSRKITQNGDMEKVDEISKEDKQHVLNTIGLLSYENPYDSPLSFMMSNSIREDLFHRVNRFILESKGKNPYSVFEKLFLQFVLSKQMLKEECADALDSALTFK